MPTKSYFPLRWESTGDQWWYATPIDVAAANGHYDLVKQLLKMDPNLLIKLTSLRRIRRLETVWDDFRDHVARCRAHVARRLLLGCEPNSSDGPARNSLIRAGYGGWLLYTAASAGDVGFVKELLERDPIVVFGEGEYGITDILYGAARSQNCEVFRILFGFAVNMMKNGGSCEEGFMWEMMNRALHTAARGGNLDVLKEFLYNCCGVLEYRDAQGSTILHSASGRGQVEVVKYLITTYDIINSTDNQGNTALHVAAYKGYSSIVEVLALSLPSLALSTNNNGDTFLHMAVSGFRSPGFHRIEQHMDLMKQLVSGKIVSVEEIINIRNNEGRTPLHLAVADNIRSDIVDLLMKIHSIDLNIVDFDGFTPLDLVNQLPKSANSEILIKRLISAGGISNCQERNTLVGNIRIQGICTSPGTSFRFPDGDLFLYANNDNDNESEVSCELPSSRFSSFTTNHGLDGSESTNPASRKLKFILEPYNLTPLRQKFSRPNSLANNKFPSPSTKEKFATSLMHGVIQATPPKSCFSSANYSPTSSFSKSSVSSPTSEEKLKSEYDNRKGNTNVRSMFFSGPLSCERSQVNNNNNNNNKHRRLSSFNKGLMNQYFCFGTQGLAVEDSVSYRRANHSYKRLVF